MDPQKFTVEQLKEELKRRQLPTTGKKTELILRLDQADPSRKWMDEIVSTGTSGGQEDDVEGGSDQEEYDQPANSGQTAQILRDREFDLMKRERDLMERENALLRQEMELLRTVSRSPASSTSARVSVGIRGISELLHEYNGNGENFIRWKTQVLLLRDTYELDDNSARILVGSKLKGKALNWYHSRPEHLQMELQELLIALANMFDQRPGKLELRKKFEARIWSQEETFSDYCHDKTILGNQVPIAEDELVDYVIDGIPDEQLQNQARMHSFGSLHNLLAGFQKIKLTQTRSGYKRDFTLSFNKLKNKTEGRSEAAKLSGTSLKETEATSKTGIRRAVRCFNCGESGHISRECEHSKQICSRCGKTNHVTKGCTATVEHQINLVSEEPDQSKESFSESPADTEEEEEDDLLGDDIYLISETEPRDEYTKTVHYNICGKDMTREFSLITQIDTGCRISLIKERYVRQNEIREIGKKFKFYGINKSPLSIRGKIIARVTIDGTIETVPIFVVSDKTMQAAALLGRDTLKQFGYQLIKVSEHDQPTKEIEYLELMSYFRKAIEWFSVLVRPLYNLLQEDFVIEQENSCERNLEIIRSQAAINNLRAQPINAE